MVSISKENILEKLATVKDPELGKDIVSLGLISDIIIKNGNVGFSIEVDPKRGPSLDPLRKEAENVVRKILLAFSLSPQFLRRIEAYKRTRILQRSLKTKNPLHPRMENLASWHQA